MTIDTDLRKRAEAVRAVVADKDAEIKRLNDVIGEMSE